MVVIRPALEWEAEYIGAHLRAEDEREIRTATQRGGEEAVPQSFRGSLECYTVRRVEGSRAAEKPCGIFGVCASPEPSYGIVWFLATPEMTRCALSFIREVPHWLNHLSRNYEWLYNVADERNDSHIRWCLLTGFHLGASLQVNGERFRYIYRPRTHV